MGDKSDPNPTKTIHHVYTVTNIRTRSESLMTPRLHTRLRYDTKSSPTLMVQHLHILLIRTMKVGQKSMLLFFSGFTEHYLMISLLESSIQNPSPLKHGTKSRNYSSTTKVLVVALEHEFNNLTLCVISSLEAYCQCLKDLASQLKDMECLVTTKRLVL